jgi:hypothetical protein
MADPASSPLGNHAAWASASRLPTMDSLHAIPTSIPQSPVMGPPSAVQQPQKPNKSAQPKKPRKSKAPAASQTPSANGPNASKAPLEKKSLAVSKVGLLF